MEETKKTTTTTTSEAVEVTSTPEIDPETITATTGSEEIASAPMAAEVPTE